MKSRTRMVSFFTAYVCLLMGFVALGLFVYALAAGSPLTMIAGAGLALFFVAAVVGFRAAARQRAESNESGTAVDGANMWAKTLRREQIDRYLRAHRAQPAVQPTSMPASTIADQYRQAA
jgi:thiol:disulfide interchange protein